MIISYQLSANSYQPKAFFVSAEKLYADCWFIEGAT